MKKIICASIALLMAVLCLCSCGKTTTSSTTGKPNTDPAASNSGESENTKAEGIGIHHVEMKIKDYGTVKLELDGDTAPITVRNFLDLAESGFYDGLTFHRIMKTFMAQGGDPQGDGYGGSDKKIKGEFAANGIENNISHVRGTISMARGGYDMDSASSQFFIVHEDSTFLDGNYAGFGHVTEGMEAIDKICEDARPTDDNGTIPADRQPVIEKITVID